VKQTIAYQCTQCKLRCVVEARPGGLTCPHCSEHGGNMNDPSAIFNHCSVCQCRQFYVSKDFNRVLGFLILAISIVLVPKTYGLSLPVCALIDWILYKRVPTLVNCYKCKAQFRGFDAPKRLKPFSHLTGMMFDDFRK